MSTALKLRRGTTAQHATFTGAAGEITLDTDKNTIVVHDGTTAGGHPLSSDAALGTAAFTDSTDYATAAQGALADSALQADDIGVSVQAYDADTTKNDVANAFTAKQTITATDNSDGALEVTQGGTAEVLRLKNSAGLTPVLILENTDTTVDGSNIYGSLQFHGNDVSAVGLQAKIEAKSATTAGGADLILYTTGAGSTTPIEAGRFKSLSSQYGSAYFTTEQIRCVYINGVIHLYGTVTMTNVDTTVDVDISEYFASSSSGDNTNLLSVSVSGLYDNGAGTYARLHKKWSQTNYYSGTTYVTAGAALDSSYNSDATNFPAGAVNAAKVASVVSASSIVLRFTNRTSPAAASTTTFVWNATVTQVYG